MQPESVKAYYFADWEPGGVYHVFNRAVHLNHLFASRSDFFKFRDKIRDEMSVFASIFAYCFLPNHFHIVLRLCSEEELIALLGRRRKLGKREKSYLAGEIDFNQYIGHAFGNAFKGYALGFNQRTNRSGTLFDQTVRRIRVKNDLISRRLIMYVHTNEVKHHLHSDYLNADIRSSIYHYLPERAHERAWVDTETVLERFGSLQTFLARHAAYVRKYGSRIATFDEERYFGYGGRVVAEAPYVEWLDGDEEEEEEALTADEYVALGHA